MAASLPTGLGFGAGYGAGVRIGYDVLYPKLQPFAQELVSGIVNAVRTVWSPGGSQATPPSPAAPDIPGVPERPDKIVIPGGRSRDIAAPCSASHKRWTSLQRESVALTRSISNLKGRRLSQTRTAMARARSLANARSKLKRVANELNAALNNPNNQSCVSTWDPKAAF